MQWTRTLIQLQNAPLSQRLGLKERIKGHFSCSIERSVIDVPACAHFGWGGPAVLQRYQRRMTMRIPPPPPRVLADHCLRGQ
jgi:hypothetical protein